jgi:hypothetical protein
MLCVREFSVDSCEHSLTSFLYSQKQYALFQESVRNIGYIHKIRSLIPCSGDINADLVGKYLYKNSFSCLPICHSVRGENML